MAKHEKFKVVFPTLGITCNAVRIPNPDGGYYNEHYWDWWCSQLPLPEVLWSHTMVSGLCSYVLNLPMKEDFPYRYSDSELNAWLDTMPEGYIQFFLGTSKNGMAIIKYGEVTEFMQYPAFAMIEEADIPKLKEAGKALWDAIYNTKEIVTIKFEL
jgi:hypothetical protein